MKAITIGQFIKRENNNLDLIRILCAYFVIYAHAFVLSPSEGSNDILYKITLLGHVSFGGLAVKTFFLISGLLVTNSLLANGRIINYVSSRFLRVFPAYALTVIVSALIISPWLSTLSLFDYFTSSDVWSYVIKTLKLDVQYHLPGVFSNNATNAINGSLWTIPMEVKAYSYLLLIYLASLLFGPYKKLFIAFISIVILVEPFTPLKGHLIAKSDSPSIYLLYPFFAIGCLLAILKDRVTTRDLLATAIIALIAFFIVNDEVGKTALFYVFATMLLLYCASTSYLKRLKIKNDISYGIYLWAFPTQQVIASVFVASPYINIVLSMFISSIFAYLSFKWVESPAMTINKRLKKNHVSLQNDRV
ncbi:acyltransferase [Serratia marcescens]|uniref:acyltransferase family protein n=1 Tax=Serratia marcescens TaxID=615 RepID=UPI001C564C0B|nr:acyltransferase [Serratia marcescens]QXX94419.1 acyltransferase [Serratia marcescens]